jgi:hypothetical protein
MSIFGRRKGGGRRSAERVEAPLVAVFTTVTRSHAATLVDVSATGARLKGSDLPGAGELAELRIGDVCAFGIVRWVADGECGLVFEVPLRPIDVASVRGEVRSAAGLPPDIRAAYEDWTVGFAR